MSSEEHSQSPALPINVGIVGATGMVGELMRSILADREIPLGQDGPHELAHHSGRADDTDRKGGDG